jgi:hypothetical protein
MSEQEQCDHDWVYEYDSKDGDFDSIKRVCQACNKIQEGFIEWFDADKLVVECIKPEEVKP